VNMQIRYKNIMQAAVLLVIAVIISGWCVTLQKIQVGNKEVEKIKKAYQEAACTPTAPYPETVTYTLAKMTAVGDSFMPEGDTYEDNAYTRFLKEFLNVQNENVIEVSEDENYDLYVNRLIAEDKMPDVVLISDLNEVKRLAEEGIIEDLTTAFEQCTSGTIKEIYEGYGPELIDAVTIDGKLMALPSTQVYYGCSLFWVRQDWMDELGLDAPKTLDDVGEIVLTFRENNMGGEGNIGLACTDSMVGTGSSNYSLDPVFSVFGAYPQIWLENENGELQYGSLSAETKYALEYLNGWYEKGVLDEDYMMRTVTEIGNLVKEGHCGAFFGWWWAPNSPLLSSVAANKNAVWKPYLIGDEDGKVKSYVYAKGTQYIVVRKGYEHPEIVMKITTALFDNARFLNESTKEIDEYQINGVDVNTRPLVINCDYSDSVFRTTVQIQAALDGLVDVKRLSALERAYYEACKRYLSGENEPDFWAAYASRIEAVELMNKGDISYINEDYVQSSNQSVPEELRDLEILSFMKIITGEEDSSYFDIFVETWKNDMFLGNISY
jgi:putative aldouronate transport system substrate-binding protein